MTPEERSRNMAAIKGSDTKPELLVRRYLHAHGFRYGLHNRKLPGSPDIVLRKYKTVIFINGCFWHGHENCKYYRLPKSNIDFWQNKITRNRKRDAETAAALVAKGWRVITIWECKLKTVAQREATLSNLVRAIKGIPAKYELSEYDELPVAAEPEQIYNEPLRQNDVSEEAKRQNDVLETPSQ